MTLKDELIAAIQNEQLHFDMGAWALDIDEDAPDLTPAQVTCGTALCMAGHICALRPELAKAHPQAAKSWLFDAVAASIWQAEMGEECRLDFMMDQLPDNRTVPLTRGDAVRHIQGEHPEWPLLPDLDAL